MYVYVINNPVNNVQNPPAVLLFLKGCDDSLASLGVGLSFSIKSKILNA